MGPEVRGFYDQRIEDYRIRASRIIGSGGKFENERDSRSEDVIIS